jgi:hypothetical protein
LEITFGKLNSNQKKRNERSQKLTQDRNENLAVQPSKLKLEFLILTLLTEVCTLEASAAK